MATNKARSTICYRGITPARCDWDTAYASNLWHSCKRCRKFRRAKGPNVSRKRSYRYMLHDIENLSPRYAQWSLLTRQPAQSPAAIAQAVVRRGSAPNPARREHLRGERQGHRSALPLHPLLAGSSFATPPAPPGVSDGLGHRSALPQDPLLPGEVVPHSSPKPPTAHATTSGREGCPSQHTPQSPPT